MPQQIINLIFDSDSEDDDILQIEVLARKAEATRKKMEADLDQLRKMEKQLAQKLKNRKRKKAGSRGGRTSSPAAPGSSGRHHSPQNKRRQSPPNKRRQSPSRAAPRKPVAAASKSGAVSNPNTGWLDVHSTEARALKTKYLNDLKRAKDAMQKRSVQLGWDERRQRYTNPETRPQRDPTINRLVKQIKSLETKINALSIPARPNEAGVKIPKWLSMNYPRFRVNRGRIQWEKCKHKIKFSASRDEFSCKNCKNVIKEGQIYGSRSFGVYEYDYYSLSKDRNNPITKRESVLGTVCGWCLQK